MTTRSAFQRHIRIAAVRGSARRDLILMAGILIAVIALSTALYWAARSGRINLPALLGTANHGDLITPPRAIADLPLRTESGQPFVYAQQPAQWTILIPVGSTCDETCAQTLYLTRQIHIALGREADRVRRYLVSKDGPPDTAFQQLLTQHPGVKVLLTSPAAFDRFFSGFAPTQQYFIVDPAGWMMMAYTHQHAGKGVIADLKRLLANSHENEVPRGDN